MAVTDAGARGGVVAARGGVEGTSGRGEGSLEDAGLETTKGRCRTREGVGSDSRRVDRPCEGEGEGESITSIPLTLEGGSRGGVIIPFGAPWSTDGVVTSSDSGGELERSRDICLAPDAGGSSFPWAMGAGSGCGVFSATNIEALGADASSTCRGSTASTVERPISGNGRLSRSIGLSTEGARGWGSALGAGGV